MTNGIISTRFTKEYLVKYPFASAGMAFFGTSDLAIAVCKAGGIGSIGVGILSPEQMRSMIRAVKKATAHPLNINFIAFLATEDHIRTIIEEQVAIASFHWGLPPKNHIRLLKEAHIRIWIQVGSPEDAKRAVEEGADLIIAQGSEGGGHNNGSLPTLVLVPEIIQAVRPTMVLAAGGIATGRQIAAALCLGADGVWVGTRLVATKEAFAHPYYKERLVKANGSDTRLSSIFGPELPHFNPIRLLDNDLTRAFRGKEHLIPTSTRNEPVIGTASYFGREFQLRRFSNFLPIPGTDANLEWMPLLAGQGVGLIHEIKAAGEVVSDMMQEAASTLAALAASTQFSGASPR